MIRKTLNAAKAATFSIALPSVRLGGLTGPAGTGFFVSPDGWFVTAAHVVSVPERVTRTDIDQAWLQQEQRPGRFIPILCQWPKLDFIDHRYDVALLKVDFGKNATKEWLKGRTEFPFLQTSARLLEEGEPVYSLGYPLSESELILDDDTGRASVTVHSPRVTSAIVASNFQATGPVVSLRDQRWIILDKALNYGNSGGPVVSVETGHVHALCSRFQPVKVPQPQLQIPGGGKPYVVIPSLYGAVANLSHPEFLPELRKRDIPISAE